MRHENLNYDHTQKEFSKACKVSESTIESKLQTILEYALTGNHSESKIAEKIEGLFTSRELAFCFTNDIKAKVLEVLSGNSTDYPKHLLN